MNAKEIIAQVRRIEIKTRRIVDDITAGAYHSVFKGRGIEFEEVREYTPEDDVRDIDWNVTARMGSPFIKKYVEERELTVMLAIDASASTAFGSKDKTKNERAIEIASLLAFSAIRNNDKVGLMIFTDKTELYLPPRAGKTHGLRLIRELLARKPASKGTDIAAALNRMMKMLRKRAVIFLISDFLDDKDFSKRLTIANKRHDLIGVRILDPVEVKWPGTASVSIEDSENGKTFDLFIGGSAFAEKYSRQAKDIHGRNETACKRAKVDLIDIKCGEDFVKPLVKFFRQREQFGR
ncbi:MAG TPA: DUF58 domain-containing protein [Lentisphaeria bacterium]|nr:MAG: hypothetical protein A2X45_12085 [Lentisphaerae bacterium GWF2_50_93]HCE43571.1 DUF58 domain-containing protein [Lentisphaeria bacterium]